ncbi:MAG TPA: AMP-binding protein [Bryobacteraceae bacterium]|nr:AMP-binding protein [Bryobacteraceae bacterium]
METLLEVLAEIRRLDDREALRFYNGFRTWKLSYRQLYAQIGAFVAYLDRSGIKKGDRIVFWSENRPEWVSAFWGAVARGVHVVPVDYRSSIELVQRIHREVQARLIVTGDTVELTGSDVAQFGFSQLAGLDSGEHFEPSAVSPDDIVEIVYTSGTTGDPRGVVHRHKNICSNLTPIQTEMRKYKRLARPFQPVRILDMLPLSHLFGQSLGIFIPPLLGGGAVFMLELHAGAVLKTIRRERASVLVSVPKMLVNLQHEVERRFHPANVAVKRKGIPGILERWWRYRHVHRALGLKFWALVVGGAEVNAEAEAFWTRLGFLVIQGYGLTETSPVVALNHPFNARSGSIGKPLPGQEVRIAEDGEILVRGESVIRDYVGGGTQPGSIENGWLHTGDIGEFDEEGRLYYKGRKKEMIVTSEGLNVYPQDVERVLNGLVPVRDSAVIAVRRDGEEQVHAALILSDSNADPAAVVAEANRRLEGHQRIQSWSVWPEEDFPRTASTMKVKRGEVARRVAEGGAALRHQGVESILERLKGREAASQSELGISSLERVELLSELENQYDVELDESRFAEVTTVAELKDRLKEAQAVEPRRREESAPPRWTRNPFVKSLRLIALEALILPAFRLLAEMEVEGLENLEELQPPILFAANHQSHLDTPAIFAALPLKWRYRLAPAMSQDFFRAWFEPKGHGFGERLQAMLQYYPISGLFNTYPLPQRMAGVRRALKYTGELIDRRYCPLVFPEGARSTDGKLQPFKTGIGLMAVELRVPVVPIHLRGLFEIYSIHQEWPQPGKVKVSFGRPLHFDEGYDETSATRAIEDAIVRMASDHFTS